MSMQIIDTIPNHIKDQLRHFSHDHPLIYVIEVENPKARCSACGVALYCRLLLIDCHFFLHQPCTELPRIDHSSSHLMTDATVRNVDSHAINLLTNARINNHLHLLSLQYSLHEVYVWDQNCLICDKDESLHDFGGYVCEMCNLAAHINCAALKLEEPGSVPLSIHLPNTPDLFPSLVIQSEFQLMRCNACIQPIIGPPSSYYSCPQPQCSFLLHQLCDKFPHIINYYLADRPLQLFSKSSNFSSVFHCVCCEKQCNGFGYTIGEDAIDVADRHQVTFVDCDYYIHMPCAFLPKSVKHKFDEHPLDLVYNPTNQIQHEEDKEIKYFSQGGLMQLALNVALTYVAQHQNF
ncbi:uncharacterized protein [Henckelia pumila]|uniref:uncharacterized protein n=1 Tax=Henckelia pumila TaxID=405737 RepID=UPI003C6DCE63